MFLRNYRFGFLHVGHNQQAYKQRKGFDSNAVSWFFASKSGHSQKSKVFLLTFVDIQSHISVQLQPNFFQQGFN